MAALLQTWSGVEGAEGNDALKDFFDSNSKLKLEWYNKLVEDDIDYDDLLESDDNGLVKLLEGCGLNGKAVTRIRNAIRKRPESVSYKLLHSTKVSIVSREEDEAAGNIEKESEKIIEAIVNITNIIKRLNANWQQSASNINNVFDNIVRNVNKRRQILLKELKDITNNKDNQLSVQKNIFSEKVKQFNSIYEETQNMMKDTSIDASKRKMKILTDSKEILDSNINLIPKTNDKINVYLEVNKLNKMISEIGMICDGNNALAPMIQVKHVTSDGVVIVIERNDDEKECIAHKVEYIESNDDNKDDEKLEWISANVNSNKASIEYAIKALKPASKYIVRAKSQNKNGWGMYSKCVSFKTKNFDHNQFAASQMVFDSFGIDSSIIQIVNSKQVKCLKQGSNEGGSVRMKFGMPTKYNNTYGLKSISWKVTPTIYTGGSIFCMGVVSNRAKEMKAAYHGLKDAYGINNNAGYVYKGNPQNKTYNAFCKDNNYKGFINNETLRIDYNINKSVLQYFENNERNAIYTIQLPQHIETITHWYPCISLYYPNDICRVDDVIVR